MQLEQFAKSRGFTAEELKPFGIRVEGDTVTIPTLGRGGQWYERIHRPGGSPKYLSPQGAASHLYNPLGLGPHNDEVWIAEGEFDTLSLVVAGAPAVGILGTSSFSEHWALLFEHAEIVLALDSDDAGNKRAIALAQLWEPGQVSRFDPSPYNDLNDYFKIDRAGFEEAVKKW